MSAAGRKKGIFGTTRAKTGQGSRFPLRWFATAASQNSFAAAGRVSAGAIGVKSLAVKNLRLAIPDPDAAMAGLPGLCETLDSS